MQTRRAFTLTELIVVIPAVALMILLVLSCGRKHHGGGGIMKNSTLTRSLVQAMMTHASSNKDILPGRGKNGEVPASQIEYSDLGGHSVEGRYAILLENALIDSPVMLSPGDNRNTPWTAPNMVTAENYSYALLELETSAPRQQTWDGGNVSSTNPLVCDRLTSTITPNGRNRHTYKSYWSATNQAWLGSVGYGDAHAEYEDDPFVADTRFSDLTCAEDDLFHDDTHGDCANGNNALMVQRGKSGVTP